MIHLLFKLFIGTRVGVPIYISIIHFKLCSFQLYLDELLNTILN